MDLVADIDCPSCKRKLSLKIKEMVPGRTKKCLGCNTTIEFSGDDGRRTQRAIDSFEKKLKTGKRTL